MGGFALPALPLRPARTSAITGEHLTAAKCEIDRVGSHPGDQADKSLVPDLPKLCRTFAFTDDDPPHVDVARSWHAEPLGYLAHPSPDLGDRKRLVVEPSDRADKPRVVPRRRCRHPEIVTAELCLMCATFVPALCRARSQADKRQRLWL